MDLWDEDELLAPVILDVSDGKRSLLETFTGTARLRQYIERWDMVFERVEDLELLLAFAAAQRACTCLRLRRCLFVIRIR